MVQRILGISGLMMLFFASAQAEQMQGSTLQPSLGEVVPLEARGDDVVFNQAVLLSGHTLIPEGTIARAVFLIPRAGDQIEVKATARERLESTFSRQPSKIGGPTEQERAATLKQRVIDANMIGTRWSDPMVFRSILHRLDSEDFALIIQRPEIPDVEVVQFNFIDGLFVSQRGADIVVLGVVKDSAAASSGLGAGHKITAINGKNWDEGISHFQKLYLREKADSQQANKPLVISFENEAGVVAEFSVPLPRSLTGSGFFDGIDP